MTEKNIIKLMKGQQLSLKAIQEKANAITSHDKEELDGIIEHLEANGTLGKRNGFYFMLEDQGIFLAKVIVKTRNFAILSAIPQGFEAKISGEESDGLFIGDLVYAKEFQQNIYHCLDYYKPVTSLRGYYTLDSKGEESVAVDYLNAAGKKVYISSFVSKDSIKQGDLIEGDITETEGDRIYIAVTKVLVRADDVGSDISMIIAENNGLIDFPEAVTEEAKNIPQTISAEDLEGRTDFRDHCVVTIDGDDSHDFDDAVEAKRYLNGYQVTVHIADVTHYVKPHHPLDDEAIARGTSIYVADRVVPMLPFELSNGICSLNPGVDRLVLSVTMEIDAQGKMFLPRVERGVIRSHGRLTYNKVNEYFEKKESEYSKEIQETLDILHEASIAIRKRRNLNGAMELDSTELSFHLDETGMPVSVEKKTQGPAEKMIEDLMIEANVAVAKMLREAEIPVLYRVHENPPADKLEAFKQYLKKMDLLYMFPKNDNITAERLNTFLDRIDNASLRQSVSYMMLRAMAKARYSPEELGHFGLAELEYCHFTSPIRRYPDDIIHRLVKNYLIDKKEFDYDSVYSHLLSLGDDMSSLEVRADHIERETEDLESAKYMSQRIGEFYHGKVTGLIQRGMFVETEEGIEGFLAFHSMASDLWKFGERSYEAYAKETEETYTIGSPIDIKVLSVDLKNREIDFCDPLFYDIHAVNMTESDRRILAREGLQYFRSDEEDDGEKYGFITGKARFNGEHMDNENEEENYSAALESFDNKETEIAERKQEEFRPTPEQWKKVDVIRAVMAMYPDDIEKVKSTLAVMDISEEEFNLLLRFTKPREDRGSRRGGDRGGRSFGRKPSGDRRGGDRGGRSFGGRGGSGDRHSDRGERRSFGDRGDRKPYGGKGGRSFDRKSSGDRHSDRSFHRDDRHEDRTEEAPVKHSYGSKGMSRGGYGKKKRG